MSSFGFTRSNIFSLEAALGDLLVPFPLEFTHAFAMEVINVFDVEVFCVVGSYQGAGRSPVGTPRDPPENSTPRAHRRPHRKQKQLKHI